MSGRWAKAFLKCEVIILETAVEAHVQLQSMKPKGFSTAPQFTKVVNSSMASNG
jgi:hypothetical protein